VFWQLVIVVLVVFVSVSLVITEKLVGASFLPSPYLKRHGVVCCFVQYRTTLQLQRLTMTMEVIFAWDTHCVAASIYHYHKHFGHRLFEYHILSEWP
jgi:hypothetical protein